MKEHRVTVKVILDTRRSKVSGKYPLKLRLTCKGERRYYNTIYDISTEEWEAINSDQVKGRLRTIRNEISALELDAEDTIRLMDDFSFSKFEKRFYKNSGGSRTMNDFFKEYIDQLTMEKRIGTAESYQTALNALIKFKGNKKVSEITAEYLSAFEEYLLSKGRSITTVGIYLRPLRVILNIALNEGLITKQDYPFGKHKYVIPTGNNVKKAIGLKDISKIINYQCASGFFEERSRDFWLLSYLCNGMNMMDLCQLKVKNLEASQISFIREKTKNTTRSTPQLITIFRSNKINQIILKWRSEKSAKPDSYLFNILNEEDNCLVLRKKIKQFTKVTNEWMEKIGMKLGIQVKLTTYVARHSFATILIQEGNAPIKYVSEKLGHSCLATTEKYIGAFSIKIDKQFSKVLLPLD
ncbi:MAG: site-specific integrase [Sediminibacterium sp.]|nr:site-specific integrase [Sediminibacterium sp.]